jgi:hypothetical protein
MDTPELRKRQVKWQEWRNNLFGQQEHAKRQADIAARRSKSTRSIEGSMARAAELESQYDAARALDDVIKSTRRAEMWTALDAALIEAEKMMQLPDAYPASRISGLTRGDDVALAALGVERLPVGFESKMIRVALETETHAWFASLNPVTRGEVISYGRKTYGKSDK